VNGTAGKLSTRETAKFGKAARERYEILSRLVESSPEEVLRYKLVLGDAAEVPSKTAGFFERQVQLTGEFEVIAECEENNFKIERFIKTAEGKVPLYFQDPPDNRSGTTLSLSGISIDGKIAVESYSSAEAELLPNTTGEKKVLVILVNFQDKQTQPYTVERANDVTFNTASNFFRENSYGQT
jgi:hypothetical protein